MPTRLFNVQPMMANGRMLFLSRAIALTFVSLIATAHSGSAQAALDNGCQIPIDTSAEAVRWDDGKHLCYSAAILENLNRLKDASPDDAPIIRGDLAVYLAMIGEDRLSRRVIADMRTGRARGQGDPETLSVDGVTGVDAVEAIVSRAADHRLIVINEAHHVSRHRDLVRRLLPGLRAAGYTHLAAEALAFDLSPEAGNAPPTARSGWYLRDPAFARLITRAQQLGFVIVAYEAAPPQDVPTDRIAAMQAREQAQAVQLLARTFTSSPEARTLVLVGYDHVEEIPRERSDGKGHFMWMTAELKRITGLDPLTIDQTTLNEQADPRLEAPEYRALAAVTGGDSSMIVDSSTHAGRVFGKYAGRVDLQVIHPPSPTLRGRETWRWEGMIPLEVQLPAGSANGQYFLAQAVPLGAGASVPLDQTIVSDGDRRPLLVSDPEHVRIKVIPLPDRLAAFLEVAHP